jgi:hypothetical protein
MTPEILAGVKVFVGWWAVWLFVYVLMWPKLKEKFKEGQLLASSCFAALLCWAIWWGFW